ncbi:MAG: hypothetical protein M3478_03735, partial [Planctomycetota bacterium]|nr:hypothetical protein [Planctomycetota bacterium]
MKVSTLALLHAFWITALALIATATALSVIPRSGRSGRAVSDTVCRAPLLDVIVSTFTWVP